MEPFLFHTGQSAGSLSWFKTARNWVWQELYVRRLNTPAGYFLLALLTLFLSREIALRGWQSAGIVFFCILLVPSFITALLHVRFGLFLLLSGAFLLPGIRRLTGDTPIGIFMYAGVISLLFGTFLQQVYRHDWSFAKHPLSVAILGWCFYLLVELINPWAGSQIAWIYGFWGLGGMLLVYYPALYAFRELDHLRRLTLVWLILAVFAAAYNLVIYPSAIFDINQWLHLSTEVQNAFVFFSDRASGNVVLCVSALVALIFALGKGMSRNQQLAGISGAAFILLALALMGSRSALALIPAGLLFLSLITLNRRWLVAGLIFTVAGIALWFYTTEQATWGSLRQSLNPFASPNFVVTQDNESYIQPYIRRHPIGGGVGSTGEYGERFAPDTLLSEFFPESGYVRIAAETGWLGLLLFAGVLFMALAAGVNGYFRVKSPRIRTWYAAFLTATFVLAIGNYSTQVLVSLPGNVLFAISMAAMVRLRHMDELLPSETSETVS
ncbi:MAG: O-antigen ligase domain-containing protein [Bacteroidetes bacterium]|nr:MAG: O-antigen ligase domain-containing protein [Bacteroidota bacterium]